MLVLVAAMCLAGGAYGDSVRDSIEGQYRRWARAYVANDVEAVLLILAKDYTLTVASGKVVSRRDYETSLRQRKAAKAKSPAYSTRIVKISVEGGRALVVSEEVSVSAVTDPLSHKAKQLVHTHVYDDTWIRAGATWRLLKTVTKEEKTSVKE